MSIAEIRSQLHLYINEADEQLLELLYKIASTYPDMEASGSFFTAADIDEFERRRQSRMDGTSATISLNELREKLIPKN